MAKVRAHHHAVNVGELSVSGMARTDQERTRLGAEIQENLFPYTVGKARVRPGKKYLLTAPGKSRYLPFVKATDDVAMLELSNGLLRVIVSDAVVTRPSVTSTVSNGSFATADTTVTMSSQVSPTVTLRMLTGTDPTFTITSASPCVVTRTAGVHGLTAGSIIIFGSGGTLPSQITAGTPYFVLLTGLTTTAFRIATTAGGTAINTTSTGSTSGTTPLRVTQASHGLASGDVVRFATTGALPTGVTAATDYYVSATGLLSGEFFVSATDGGSLLTAAGSQSGTQTISKVCVVTWASHGLSAGDTVQFTTTGALPTGVTASTIYYVLSAGLTANAFRISATAGGSAIATSGTQSGVHTAISGWTTAASTGSTCTISGGSLTMQCARGGTASCTQAVTTSSAGTQHALNIVVSRGPVVFRCGSTSGGGEYISETSLDTGTHSLAFTPTGTYYPYFFHSTDRSCVVDSITVASAGALSFVAPWTEAELFQISHDQSLDVVFLAHENWQSHAIERRGTNSWSLVKFEADDGPFTTVATNNITLTPGAAYGLTTMTASSSKFRSTDVGSIISLSTKGAGASFVLGALGAITDPVRIIGQGDDNDSSFTVSGTFVGTVAFERSYDGENLGFITTSSTRTAAGTTAVAPGVTLDNVEHWVRARMSAYTSGSPTVSINYTGNNGTGYYRITGYTSATVVSVEVLKAASGLTASDDWALGAWSDRRGWPSTVRLFDGRLWFAGEGLIWGSRSDNFYSFKEDSTVDDGAITRQVATGGTANNVRWMMGLQRLIIGTDGAEVSARSSSFDEPLTPTNVTLKDASSQGVAAIAPVKFDSRAIFVQRSLRKIFEIVYDLDSNDYTSNDLTRLNETILEDGVIDMAVQRQPEPWIWCVMADGTCVILLYAPKEQVAGFFNYIESTSDLVESVCVLPGDVEDRVYFSVKRVINGSTVRYLEKMALFSQAVGAATNLMADSYVYNAGPVTTFTGLSHLEGESVVAWGNSKPLGTYTVSGGQITLSASATNVCVGLSYSWRFKTAKLAYGAEGGTALLQPKRLSGIGMLLEKTHMDAISFGPDFTNTNPMPRVEEGVALTANTIHAVYDEQTFPFPGTWDTDARVCLSGSAPYPATIAGFVLLIETNEK